MFLKHTQKAAGFVGAAAFNLGFGLSGLRLF
jgi:hypothetical protein